MHPLTATNLTERRSLNHRKHVRVEPHQPYRHSALLFQPRIIALWLVVAVIMQRPSWFFALAAVLWWSALAPRLNPFDALYNWTLARRGGPTLTAAPAPRRFARALAGLFALAIGVSLTLDWRTIALVIEGLSRKESQTSWKRLRRSPNSNRLC
jgi:hypothetical protein